MANTLSLNLGDKIKVPYGYYPDSINIKTPALAGLTSATATAGDILTGKTAWVNGQKITGTLVDPPGTVKLAVNEVLVSKTLLAGKNAEGSKFANSKRLYSGDILYMSCTIDGNKMECIELFVTLPGVSGSGEIRHHMAFMDVTDSYGVTLQIYGNDEYYANPVSPSGVSFYTNIPMEIRRIKLA